jgi:Xaa-Pro aminopeptidase
VLQDKAVVMTDGRYTIQVKDQTDPAIWETADITKSTPGQWLAEHASDGARIGYDPWLHTKADLSKIIRQTKDKSLNFVPVETNPVDDLWTDRPSFPASQIELFPDHIAGKTAVQKIKDVVSSLRTAKGRAFLFTAPDSVAWLLNIRGTDVPHTPVPLSYALVNDKGTVEWFIASEKVPDEVLKKLESFVTVQPVEELPSVLSAFQGTILLDELRTPVRLVQILENAGVTHRALEDPVLWKRASKTSAEQRAIKDAHLVDGQALIKFQDWIKSQKPGQGLDELAVEQKLAGFRAENDAYKGLSFDTIAGFQGNGAIIHYRATPPTNKKIDDSGLLLVDSGGQYFCDDYAGTTDVTRTIVIGTPTKDEKFHYTLVLKAHIAVSMAQFPYGATGVQIDTIARKILWDHGLDFAHGLGHGVGCFLNVHEDSARLSPKGQDKLEPGMLLSNEPGLYFERKYGIRIENLVLVQKTGEQDNLGRDILCFETVTFVPYDEDLIIRDMLSAAEQKWLRAYEEKVKTLFL